MQGGVTPPRSCPLGHSSKPNAALRTSINLVLFQGRAGLSNCSRVALVTINFIIFQMYLPLLIFLNLHF